MSTRRGSETPERISMKLGMYKYVRVWPRMQSHVALRQPGWSRRTLELRFTFHVNTFLTIYFYRQHCQQRKAPVFKLLREQLWGLSPRRCNDNGIGPQKLKILLKFCQISEYKHLAGAYPLRDFHKICRICTLLQNALADKIWMELLKELRNYVGYNLREWVSYEFPAPLAAKLCVGPPQKFPRQERARDPLSPFQVWWGSDFTRGSQKRWIFCLSLCLFICLSITLLNIIDCASPRRR